MNVDELYRLAHGAMAKAELAEEKLQRIEESLGIVLNGYVKSLENRIAALESKTKTL